MKQNEIQLILEGQLMNIKFLQERIYNLEEDIKIIKKENQERVPV
jgi:hypothetical protein